jgi:hypothetical protein
MRSRTFRIVTGALVLAVAIAGCSNDKPGAKRGSDGKVVKAGTVSVFDLKPADCIDPPPDLSGDVATVPVVPCDQPHTQEVFSLEQSTASAYPGPEALASTANGLCLSSMQTDLGLSPDDGYFISYLLPSFDGWNKDKDRTIVCVFVFPTLGSVTGSVVEQVQAGTVQPGSPPPVSQVIPGAVTTTSASVPATVP